MNKIYIGNLPFKITDAELEALFVPFGEIVEVALIKDRFTGEPKGFAFITFKDQASAQNALEMDGKEFGGRQMRVSMAREGEKRTGGGGGRRGGDRGGNRGGDRGDRGGKGGW